MTITTKEVFQWNKNTEKYDSIECESYEYSGKVDKCDCNESDSWWTGANSWWCKGTNFFSGVGENNPGLNPFAQDKGSLGFGGFQVGWDTTEAGNTSYFFTDRAGQGGAEEEILKYGIILVGAYMLMRR